MNREQKLEEALREIEVKLKQPVYATGLNSIGTDEFNRIILGVLIIVRKALDEDKPEPQKIKELYGAVSSDMEITFTGACYNKINELVRAVNELREAK
jgi:hypothetical protein